MCKTKSIGGWTLDKKEHQHCKLSTNEHKHYCSGCRRNHYLMSGTRCEKEGGKESPPVVSICWFIQSHNDNIDTGNLKKRPSIKVFH